MSVVKRVGLTRASATIVVVLLLVISGVMAHTLAQSDVVSAQTSGSGICDRTQQVRGAILAKLPNVSDWARRRTPPIRLSGDLSF